MASDSSEARRLSALRQHIGSRAFSNSWVVDQLKPARGSREVGMLSAPGHPPTSATATPRAPSLPLQQGLCLKPWPHAD